MGDFVNGERVTYTVKELLAIQTDRLDRIETKLGDLLKAIYGLEHRVGALEARAALEPRVHDLERATDREQGTEAERRYIGPIFISAAISVATSVGGWIFALAHGT